MGKKYKLYGLDNGEIYYIDNRIPLHNYLWFLNTKRGFNKEKVIEYTKKIYGIDIGDIIKNSKFWNFDIDIYKKYEKDYPRKIPDDMTREYFNEYGKKYYQDFAKQYFNLNRCAVGFHETKIIHHIFPLVYGGDNSLENLIHLSEENHKILHNNPKEYDEVCCFKALDYLGYLYSEDKLYDLINKYQIQKYSSQRLKIKILLCCIEEEMEIFYESIS